MTGTMHRAHILIVDDEPNLRRTLALILRKAGHRTTDVASGAAALRVLDDEEVLDLVFLDLRMPEMSGMELLARVRERRPQVPVLILTGHASLDTAIEAVRQGARDYLMKPLDPPQIVTRVGELLAETRQPQRQREIVGEIQSLLAELQGVGAEAPGAGTPAPADADRTLRRGPFTLDLRARQATLHGRALDLAPTAFDYLATLMRHAPEPVPYRQLVREAQGYEVTPNEARDMARWHIHQLRKAIAAVAEEAAAAGAQEADAAREYVVTKRGVGYFFVG